MGGAQLPQKLKSIVFEKISFLLHSPQASIGGR